MPSPLTLAQQRPVTSSSAKSSASTLSRALMSSLLPMLTLAAPALSDELELTFGIQLSQTYVSDGGLTWDSDTIETSLDASYAGFLLGMDLSSLSDDPPDSAELELSFGYALALSDDVEVSLVYARSFLNRSGLDGEELTLALAAEVSDLLSGGFAIIHDPETQMKDVEIELELSPGENWSFGLLAGRSEADDNRYGEVSISYALDDTTAIEALYEDTDDDLGMLTLSVIFEVDVSGN